jgi:hypothetical protein
VDWGHYEPSCHTSFTTVLVFTRSLVPESYVSKSLETLFVQSCVKYVTPSKLQPIKNVELSSHFPYDPGDFTKWIQQQAINFQSGSARHTTIYLSCGTKATGKCWAALKVYCLFCGRVLHLAGPARYTKTVVRVKNRWVETLVKLVLVFPIHLVTLTDKINCLSKNADLVCCPPLFHLVTIWQDVFE